jgi:ParB family chromosome partitioning protein
VGSKRKPLGKGLSALLGATKPRGGEGEKLVDVREVKPNPDQPRKSFPKKELEELADTIRERGVIQPILVSGDPEGYTLISGERRLRAARMAGKKLIPAIVREVSPEERLEIALIENLQRENLNPIEEAEGYRSLAERLGLTHEEIAKRVGKNRTVVTNTLRLLNLPEDVRKAIEEGRLSAGHGRVLAGIQGEEERRKLAKFILRKSLSVRQAEGLAEKTTVPPGRPGQRPAKETRVEIRQIEEKLREKLGTPVFIRENHAGKKSKGGELVIHYYSPEELNHLLDLLL